MKLKGDSERRTLSEMRGDGDFATKALDDGFGDGEAEAGAFGVGFTTIETIEDVRQVFFGNADSKSGYIFVKYRYAY